MPSLNFPYMNYGEIGVPVIPFEIKGDTWHEIWGFVDSGATYTALHAEEGHRLGLNPFDGEKIMVTVGDGGSIPVYLQNLLVRVGSHEFKAMIGFSDRLGVDLNIIGRTSFFEEFIVCFDDRKKVLTLRTR